jgi:hypothetical protein
MLQWTPTVPVQQQEEQEECQPLGWHQQQLQETHHPKG